VKARRAASQKVKIAIAGFHQIFDDLAENVMNAILTDLQR
jgi:hypothetical protein